MKIISLEHTVRILVYQKTHHDYGALKDSTMAHIYHKIKRWFRYTQKIFIMVPQRIKRWF